MPNCNQMTFASLMAVLAVALAILGPWCHYFPIICTSPCSGRPFRYRPIEAASVPPFDGGVGFPYGRNPGTATVGTTLPPTQASGGRTLPSARAVSNAVLKQRRDTRDTRLTALAIFFGQFLDHTLDIVETTEKDCKERGGEFFGKTDFLIPVPPDDDIFTKPMRFERLARCRIDGKMTHLNDITSFIDANSVYGSRGKDAAELRTFKDGLLKVTKVDGMPDQLPNLADFSREFQGMAGCNRDTNKPFCYAAGDVRANEHVILASFHTAFVLEHNHQAAQLKRFKPESTDEELYQEARRIVIAELQAIVYNEFLPALLGDECPAATNPTSSCKLDSDESAAIDILFDGAAFRLHSGIPDFAQIQGADGTKTRLELSELFFRSDRISADPLLTPSLFLGMSNLPAMALDDQVVDGLRNNLFRSSGEDGPRDPSEDGAFDLMSRNIQRGRDFALFLFTKVRSGLGLTAPSRFEDLDATPETIEELKSVYQHVDDIDTFVGMLSEKPFKTSRLGQTATTVLCNQFASTRAADPNFFACDPDLLKYSSTRLSQILERAYGKFGFHFRPNVMVQVE